MPSAFFRFSFAEVFDALDLTINDIFPGKEFLMSATLKRTDGKIFTSENTGSNVIGQPTFQGFFQHKPEMINMPCFSNLQGTFTAHTQADDPSPFGCLQVWEGNVRWEEEHSPNDLIGYYKVYSIQTQNNNIELEDMSMGMYLICYPSQNQQTPLGDLRIKNECNVLSFVGASQWGEIYSFTKVESNGTTLNLRWQNDYGEAAFVDLTRTDGQAWPEDLTCDGC